MAIWLGYSLNAADGYYLLPPALALWLPLLPACYWRLWALVGRLLLAALVVAVIYLQAIFTPPLPQLAATGLKGQGTFAFHSAERQHTPYGERWLYRGTLTDFSAAALSPLAVTLTLPASAVPLAPPTLMHSWQIGGTLYQRQQQFTFKPLPPASWEPLGYTFNGLVATWRQQTRQLLASYLYSVLDATRSAPFLYGMLTGLFDDHTLRYHFSRFGVQHLLAISGFHFALVTACLGFVLRLLLPRRQALYTLLTLLALYCTFLGCSPSILRAWISLSLGIAAYLVHRRPQALNLMGAALGCVLIIDPLYLTQIGFQLSFTITAAILLFAQPADQALQRLVTTRPLGRVIHWDTTSQHTYIAACTIRQALALGLAVNAAALPLTLYHFHFFPWLGLLYNLFFPFLVTLSVLLLLAATLLHLAIAPLGILLHAFNSAYTHYVVGLAADAPPAFDWAWRGDLSPFFLSLYLTLLAIAGAFFYVYRHFYAQKENSLIIVPELL